MNPHLKTICIMVSGLGFLALLVVSTKAALLFEVSLCVVLTVAALGWIYGMIYMTVTGGWDTPECATHDYESVDKCRNCGSIDDDG